jgi:hypothetical protein
VPQTLNSSNQRSSTSLPLRRRAAAGVRRELLPSAARQLFGSLHHPRRKCLLAQVEGEAQANPPGPATLRADCSIERCTTALEDARRGTLTLRDAPSARGCAGTARLRGCIRRRCNPKGAGPPRRWRHLIPARGLTATICPEEAASAPRCFPTRALDRARSQSTASSATVFAPCHFG